MARVHPVICLCVVIVSQAAAFCWEPGKNPGFTGPPKTFQVDLETIRVSWEGLVTQRACADQFLVKYWPRSDPNGYTMTSLVETDKDHVDVKVTPKVLYQFQAVAREDKGFAGIEYNKSPIAEFQTSKYNLEVPEVPKVVAAPENSVSNAQKPKDSEPKSSSVRQATDGGEKVMADYTDMAQEEESIQVLGLGLGVFIGIVAGSLIVVVIVIGIIYNVACTKKKKYEVDDNSDSEGSAEENEKLKSDVV